MGRCIAIETARARRALQNASAPTVTRRMVRKKPPGATRINRTRSAIRWSLCGRLWSAIRETFGGAHAGMEGQSRAPMPAGSLMPLNGNKNWGLTAHDEATSPHTF
jgi:hypothetical protein